MGKAGGSGGTDAGGLVVLVVKVELELSNITDQEFLMFILDQGGGGGSGNNSVGDHRFWYVNGGRGGGAGPGGWSGGGGGGGALSAILDRTVQTNQGGGTAGYTIVAGGGGGGGGASLQRSGSGAANAGDWGAQNQPIGISDGNNGNTKTSGDGGGGGAGGAGVSGGGPGSTGNDNSSGGTGGGGGTSRFDPVVAILESGGLNPGNGYGFIKYDVPDGEGTETIVTNITVSGSSTDTLTLSADAVGVTTVACRVSSLTATNSPQQSEDAKFVILDNANQYIINVEGVNNTDEATLYTVDLFNDDLTLETSIPEDGVSVSVTTGSSIPDKDIFVEMDVYGGKGDDRNSFVGGEGGFSRIRFTMERNVEYVVTGLNDLIRAPFIYRKAQLIAAVGGGGHAGTDFNGGFGGGIGVSGQDGFGRYGGDGGESVNAGTLSLDGVFGSLFFGTTTVDDDFVETMPNGGRTISCTKGVYYRDQGFAACSDVGSVKFLQSDGTEVSNTATITRGFKAGYSIIETNGIHNTNGGRGGAGATGGDGGEQGAGGGGGSGYTDGSVEVVSSVLGGSNGVARINLRVVQGGVVTFNQSKSTTENIFIRFKLISGEGPSTLEFGQDWICWSTFTNCEGELSKDAVYQLNRLKMSILSM